STINTDLIKRLSEYDGPDEQLEVIVNGDALTIYVSHSDVQGGQLLDGTVKAVVNWETGGNDLNHATFTLEVLEVEIRSPIEGRFTIPELVEVYGSSPPVKLVADLSYTGPESGTYEISYYEYGGRRLEYFEGR